MIRHVHLHYMEYRDVEANRRRTIAFVPGDSIAPWDILVVHHGGAKCVRVVHSVTPVRDDRDGALCPVANLRTMSLLERHAFNASERKKEAERVATVAAFQAEGDA